MQPNGSVSGKNPAANRASSAARPQGQGGVSLGVDDVLYILFRRKWLILFFFCMAVLGVAMVYTVRPPKYFSQAKLMIHFIQENKAVNPSTPDTSIKSVDAGAQNILASEIEILNSLDVAKEAAEKVGPEKILATFGGGTNSLAAAGVIVSGLKVDPPRSSIITVSFKHGDPEVVQPVLDALISVYMRKHLEIHRGYGVLDTYYTNQREKLRAKVAETDEKLKQLMTNAHFLFLEDSKRAFQEEIAGVTKELHEAQTELAVRRAGLEDLPQQEPVPERRVSTPVSAQDIRDYQDIGTELDSLKRRQSELMREFSESYPAVQTVREQVLRLTRRKVEFEQQHPGLEMVGVPMVGGITNTRAGELAEIRKLTARVGALGMQLTNAQTEAAKVLSLEPRITELTRQRDEDEKSYQWFMKNIEQQQNGESLAAGKVTNMSMVQNPTPPKLDLKKYGKIMGMLFGACAGMGLALAFLVELFLDRTLKRASEVERQLGVPVFLTVPDTGWRDGGRSWFGRRKRQAKATSAEAGGNLAIQPWSPGHHMQAFAEGLRERLITYFEVNNLNAKKPKLVAVTGCNKGAGVSTLASGLAASLSKTGDGNVLLVDMNAGEGVAHAFFQGKPGGGLNDVLEPETRANAQVRENLYMAGMPAEPAEKQGQLVPNRFTHLVPKLKSSDYDYIIFDLPPVSPTSITPRLSSYMDMVLLVVEAEKTGQHSATRATTLMREARANVATVLNKQRQYVPTILSHEG